MKDNMNKGLNRRDFLKAVGVCAVSSILGCISATEQRFGKASVDKPNFVIVLCDDAGYADVGCFGAKGFETP